MSNDLISRQAAKIAFVEKGQLSRRYKCGEVWELNYEEIRDVLNNLPSVQPEQNAGQWIPNKHTDTVLCSQCGKCYGDEYNYCPNCGAKMESEEIT